MSGFTGFLYFVPNVCPRLEHFSFLPFKSKELTLYPFLIKIKPHPKMPTSYCSTHQKIRLKSGFSVWKKEKMLRISIKIILKRFLVYLENQTKNTLIFTSEILWALFFFYWKRSVFLFITINIFLSFLTFSFSLRTVSLKLMKVYFEVVN